jgi:hypothetical protein
MWKAKNDLAAVSGFKTLLVLTDGEDTRFHLDTELNPGGRKSVPRFLSEVFGKSDILVNIVGFQVDELRAAKEQFKVLPEFRLPGRFFAVTETAQLGQTLSAALTQQLRCRLYQHGQLVRDAGVPEEGLDVGNTKSVYRPFSIKTPGVYELRVHTFAQNVDLREGHRLLVKLKMKSPNQVNFERAVFAETESSRVLKEGKASGWVAAVMQNALRRDVQDDTDRAQQMFITLENSEIREPGTNGYLEQIYPYIAWFEVKAEGVSTPLALSFRNRSRYPAPAWALDVAEWPKLDAAPTVHAWWLSDHPPWLFTLPGGQGRQPAQGLRDVPVQVDGEEVRIESLQFEKQRPAPDGTRKPCMVVQLRYPKDKPAVAALKRPLGAEQHQVYKTAERSTSIFWDITPDHVSQNKDFEVGIFSLDYIKKKQKASHAELKLDTPPAAASQAPPVLN